MRFAGRVFKAGKHWAIEIPILGITTQGRSKSDAFLMMRDAIETLVNKDDFSVSIHPGEGEYFEAGSNDPALFSAFMLRRLRQKHGLTLSEVSSRMGAKSHNAFARYEQGKAVPTIEMLNRLFAAVAPGRDFIVSETSVS